MSRAGWLACGNKTCSLSPPSPNPRLHSHPLSPSPSPSQKFHTLTITMMIMKKLVLFLAVVAITAVAADEVTDELKKNGLPAGLLPSSVSSYSLSDDGHFTLNLKAPCYARIDDQLAYYSEKITGTLKFGSISNLEGIETKQLFVWLAVTGIYVDVPATPYIYFEVGVLTKRLSLAVFDTPIKCSSRPVAWYQLPSWGLNGALTGPRKALLQ